MSSGETAYDYDNLYLSTSDFDAIFVDGVKRFIVLSRPEQRIPYRAGDVLPVIETILRAEKYYGRTGEIKITIIQIISHEFYVIGIEPLPDENEAQ